MSFENRGLQAGCGKQGFGGFGMARGVGGQAEVALHDLVGVVFAVGGAEEPPVSPCGLEQNIRTQGGIGALLVKLISFVA